MPVLDTSVLVAFFNADDPLHQRARDDLGGVSGAVVPYAVLVELLQVIEYRVRKRSGPTAGRRAAREAFGAIEAAGGSLAVEPPRGLAAAGRLFLEHEALSLVDAAVIAHALDAGEDLVTYDRKQARMFAARRG